MPRSRAARPALFDAMVTAPVHKALINDAGIDFSGHTEYLAERTRRRPTGHAAGRRRAACRARDHAPAARPGERRPDADAGLPRCSRVLDGDLRRRFGLRSPRILVCGLNPHAGESGHLGREEIEVIAPVVRRCAGAGMSLTGPVPADTAFVPEGLREFDAVLAMYHDQGLPVIKRASFGHAVNVTLGLPIVRTSVDHGTALDIAGTRTSRSRQPARGDRSLPSSSPPAADGHGLEPRRRSATDSISCTTPARSTGSCARSTRSQATGWSRSAPAAGAISAALLEGAGALDVIEIDPDMMPAARPGAARAAASCGCTWPMRSSSISRALRGSGAKLRLAGNLPYNVSTPLLFRLIEQLDCDRRHALHAAEGGRCADGGAARDAGLRAADGDAGAACARAAPVRHRHRRLLAAARACNRRSLRSNRCAEPPFALRRPRRLRPRRRRGLFEAPQDAAQLPPRPGRRRRRSSPPASTPAPGPRRSPPPNSPPSPHAPGLKSRASCRTLRAAI